MCKPIGQPDTSIAESESSSELQQETNSISESDSVQSDTKTAEKQYDLKTTDNYDTKSSSKTVDSLSSE